jgi:hypothetical protein
MFCSFCFSKRAMTKFDISSNDIRAEGGRGKDLAAGLKGNKATKELNTSGNELGINSKYDAERHLRCYRYCRCHPRHGGFLF